MPDDDDEALLVGVIIFGCSAAAAGIATIFALISACTRTARGVRSVAIVMMLGACITLMVQIAYIILEAVAQSEIIPSPSDDAPSLEAVYWLSWPTEVLFWTSLLSVGFTIPSLTSAKTTTPFVRIN